MRQREMFLDPRGAGGVRKASNLQELSGRFTARTVWEPRVRRTTLSSGMRGTAGRRRMRIFGILYPFAAAALALAAPGNHAPRATPVPADPLELVTGRIRTVNSRGERAKILELLAQARDSYSLRTAGQAYDLKVSFQVDSGGVTKYDGAWRMEEIFDPQQGARWTASAPGYSITRISAGGKFYGENAADYVPLRLHEARAALFDPMPSAAFATRAMIRTSAGVLNGTPLICVLLSVPLKGSRHARGRHWDEAEECIDPQSGLLQVHSQAPGRYYAYDYADAPKLAGRVLPRKVIVTEGGNTVSRIAVDSLVEIPPADPGLFVPGDEMKARGDSIQMGEAQKLWYDAGTPGAAGGTVCVFGVLTPSGVLAEAHSLQPSDPNSPAAVEAAGKMAFSNLAPLGTRPQQRFVFVIEPFAGR